MHVEALDQEARERVALAEDLRIAVARNQLEATISRRSNSVTGGIIGVEALVRWKPPSAGDSLPDAFISIAETSGNITTIGEWVIGEGGRQIACWRADGIAPQLVAVNLSAAQFKLAAELDRIVIESLAN